MPTGCHTNTVDIKGRVIIPTKLRYGLGERIWLVMGLDRCLYIFTQEAWADYKSKHINSLPVTDINARKLQRVVLGHSNELEIDRQGRINLPQILINYAGIEKDVVFLGCDDRIEVWDAAAYEKDMAPENLDLDKLMRSATETAGGD